MIKITLDHYKVDGDRGRYDGSNGISQYSRGNPIKINNQVRVIKEFNSFTHELTVYEETLNSLSQTEGSFSVDVYNDALGIMVVTMKLIVLT